MNKPQKSANGKERSIMLKGNAKPIEKRGACFYRIRPCFKPTCPAGASDLGLSTKKLVYDMRKQIIFLVHK